MDLDKKEVKDGMTWLFAAGACAIALSAFLQVVDHQLSTSDREVKLERTLKELRTAQSVLGAEVEDRRFDGMPALRKPVETSSHGNKGHDSHGHEDASGHSAPHAH